MYLRNYFTASAAVFENSTPSNFNPGSTTSYWEFPVTLITASGSGYSNFPDNHEILLTTISMGMAGPQGDQGPTGSQGSQGPQGFQGNQGATGPQGDQGVSGPQGDQGTVGPQGLQGDQGSQGPQGFQGPQGDIGPQGATGPQGFQGATGPSGGGSNVDINLFDDFFGYNTAPSSLGSAGTLGTAMFTIVKGTNGAFTKVDNTVLRFRSSSNGNTNNYCYFGTINVGLGTLELEYVFKRLIAARGHDIYIGLFNQLATINPTNMISFIYQQGTNILTTNTRNSGGTETNNISTFTGDVWNKFKIVIDSNASSVQFYLNGNLESTHTNFIPDSSISLFNEFGLNSTATSFTIVGFDVDYASIKYNLTTPR